MISNQTQADQGRSPEDTLREATVHAVESAPLAPDWNDVLQRSRQPNIDDQRTGRPMLLAVAAVSMLAVAGVLVLVARPGTQTVRTDDPPVTTVVPAPAIAPNPVVESLPRLPSELTRSWTVTIDGRYPASPVRLGETIIFGQQDLPGVRAVSAQAGELLWSHTVSDPNATVVSLHVVDERVLFEWHDSIGAMLVSAFDVAGTELWTVPGAVVDGAVFGIGRGFELVGADGSVQRTLEGASLRSLGDTQFSAEDEGGTSWYRVSDFERLAGPIELTTSPDFAVAAAGGIVTLEGARLQFLDQDGAVRFGRDIEAPGVLQAVGGQRPGVLVTGASTGFQTGVPTTFYEIVDDTFSEVWTETGRAPEYIERDGRAFVLLNRPTDGSADVPGSQVLDAVTGRVVASNDLYDDDGAANGFVFTQLDNGRDDLQTVAHDLDGGEIWRLQLEGRERAEIVDNGVLVAVGGSVGPTVELTFYAGVES